MSAHRIAAFNEGVRVLLLLVSLAAAGAAPRGASLIPVTACSAVSRLDVQLALGFSVGKGVEEEGKDHSTCDYAGTNGIVSITIHRLGEAVSLPAQRQQLRAAFPNAEFKPAGIPGASGFYMHLPKAGTQLHFLQSPTRYVLISILGFGEGPQVEGAAGWLARKILDSL